MKWGFWVEAKISLGGEAAGGDAAGESTAGGGTSGGDTTGGDIGSKTPTTSADLATSIAGGVIGDCGGSGLGLPSSKIEEAAADVVLEVEEHVDVDEIVGRHGVSRPSLGNHAGLNPSPM